MNKHAPLKQYQLKARSNPWITKEIITLMYKHDLQHKKLKDSNNNAQLHREYKKARNKVVNKIRLAKKNYYNQEIANGNTPKHMWKIIRGLLKPKDSSDQIPIDPTTFNKFFANIIISHSPYTVTKLKTFLTRPITSSNSTKI